MASVSESVHHAKGFFAGVRCKVGGVRSHPARLSATSASTALRPEARPVSAPTLQPGDNFKVITIQKRRAKLVDFILETDE